MLVGCLIVTENGETNRRRNGLTTAAYDCLNTKIFTRKLFTFHSTTGNKARKISFYCYHFEMDEGKQNIDKVIKKTLADHPLVYCDI